MAEDAIIDEVCDLNPFKGVRIRASDPRAKKKPRPMRVFSFEEMHRFAKAAGRYEAMVRVFADTGLRLGEVLPLRREDFDGETLQVRRTAHEGRILEERRPTTASQTPVASFPFQSPSLGCSRLRSRPATRTATSIHDPKRPSLARAHLLPRPLEARPGSVRPR